MGFYVKKLPGKRPYKVQHVEYLPEGKRDTNDLKPEEYERFGFPTTLTIEQAKERARQLNANSRARDRAYRINKISKRIQAAQDAHNAILGPADVMDFESSILHSDGYKKDREMHWRKAKTVLVELQILPEDWEIKRSRFYDLFMKEGISYSYIQKVINVINKWGFFQAHRYRTFFKPLPYPSSRQRFAIQEAYADKNPITQESDPLSFEMLEAKREAIKAEWYAWIYIACAFGLRPSEVDALHKPEGARTWRLVELPTVEGKKIQSLQISQGKIIKAIGRDRAMKSIPIITSEQKRAAKMIVEGEFKRPSHSRHLKAHFGERITLYGPRKCFSLWMRRLGQDQINYSRWLGHTRVERTENSYEQKHVIAFNPVKRA